MKKIKLTKDNKRLLTVIGLFIVCIIYTLLVKYYDTNAIGPKNTIVGFSALNALFSNITGYNEFFYKLTEYLGVVAFILVGYYGIIGLMQLIKRKSILKVDKRILLLGGLYVVMLLVYIFFEHVIINYRPFLIDKELEASYPSSHTMLGLCVCLSSLLISKYYFKKNAVKIVNIITIILMFILVIGRILSGAHWITDIIGGIIISAFLVYLYDYLINKYK